MSNAYSLAASVLAAAREAQPSLGEFLGLSKGQNSE
jgi:hypothetical protein